MWKRRQGESLTSSLEAVRARAFVGAGHLRLGRDIMTSKEQGVVTSRLHCVTTLRHRDVIAPQGRDVIGVELWLHQI